MKLISVSLTARAVLTVGVILGSQDLSAQQAPGYSPFPKNARPGLVGEATQYKRSNQNYFQPLRFDIEGGASIGIYESPEQVVELAEDHLPELLVGPVYRLKLTNLKDLPDAELYPTIELIDRMHPPAGRRLEFPVPITLSLEEIEEALDGGLLVKVIYLEQPGRALGKKAPKGDVIPDRRLRSFDDPLSEADVSGRPMAIIRMGNRRPGEYESPEFFGTGGQVRMTPKPAQSARKQTKSKDSRATGSASAAAIMPQPKQPAAAMEETVLEETGGSRPPLAAE